MAVLYRKYRPKNFSEVIGQKYIVRTLQNQVESGKVAHAYLFTGSRGVGKTSLARILARAVNCEKSAKGEPCGGCNICAAITRGGFLDLVEIDAASNTGVDNIRELIEHVKFSPSMGKYKVFIIDEVHMLSKGAFNALLKTLEEPPAHTIFILATTEIGKVPATIISRTQRFDFRRYEISDLKILIEKVLKSENILLPPEVVELVAGNAEGSARDALSILDKVLTLGEKVGVEETRELLGITDAALCDELLGQISEKNAEGMPMFFSSLTEKGLDFTVFARDFLEFLRKVLVAKITDSGEESPGSEDSRKKIYKHQEALSFNELIFIIRLFLKAYKDLSYSPSPELPLLVAALEAIYKSQPVAVKNSESAIPPAISAKQPGVRPVKAPKIESIEKQSVRLEEITREEAEKIWPEFIEQIKKVNSPLASMVKNAEIARVEGGVITLGVKFLFNRQNLHQPKNYEMLTRVLKQVSGKNLKIEAEVEEPILSGFNNKDSEPLAEALKIFGGELID